MATFSDSDGEEEEQDLEENIAPQPTDQTPFLFLCQKENLMLGKAERHGFDMNSMVWHSLIAQINVL